MAFLAAAKFALGVFADSLIDRALVRLEKHGYITKQQNEIDQIKLNYFQELSEAKTDAEYHAIRRKINDFLKQSTNI